MTESPPPGVFEHRAPSVLIVEDDVAVRSTLAAILDDEGWQILIAPNCFDALATLDHHEPDVVVLDWMTPVLDGRSFLATLRGG
ncbi:MAG: response regulator transcription factor, partial [Dehalococcoidia bacterium]